MNMRKLARRRQHHLAASATIAPHIAIAHASASTWSSGAAGPAAMRVSMPAPPARRGYVRRNRRRLLGA